VPQALRDALRAFEAGEPMVRVDTGSWSDLGRDAHRLRQAVFVDEQKIPADLEWDADDAHAEHALAVNRFGLAVGTGRLVQVAAGVGKIGRMAVMRDVRGGGVGRSVLDALVRRARQRGLHEVMLHAQASAVNFYQRAGFSARGPAFDEAGIPHQAMALAL
jgi:predicted GNAT family N-acyltransferase